MQFIQMFTRYFLGTVGISTDERCIRFKKARDSFSRVNNITVIFIVGDYVRPIYFALTFYKSTVLFLHTRTINCY